MCVALLEHSLIENAHCSIASGTDYLHMHAFSLLKLIQKNVREGSISYVAQLET